MKLVCPFEPSLLDRLDGRALCVRVDEAGDIVAAAAEVRRRNNLCCVICDLKVPPGEVEVEEDWRNVPIALMAPSAGRFRDLATNVAALRRLNLRVYLASDADNLTGARVLASLGIAVTIILGASPDWEALADLMTYALVGLVPHAPIEPFETISNRYRQSARSDDWGCVYFDNPRDYLHLDATGRIALSQCDLEAGDFVAGDVSALDSAEVRHAVERRTETWRSLFAEDHFCARCRAWRVCRARCRGEKPAPDGCDAFFDEMTEVLVRRRHRARRPAVLWQP